MSVGIAGVRIHATRLAKRTSSRYGRGWWRNRSFHGCETTTRSPALVGEAIGGAVRGVGAAEAVRLEDLPRRAQVREQERRRGAIRRAPGGEQARGPREVQAAQRQHHDPRPPWPAARQRAPGHERGER